MRFRSSVRSLSQGAAEVQDSAVLSTTARASSSQQRQGQRASWLASNQADFILAASEFPLWFHHTGLATSFRDESDIALRL